MILLALTPLVLISAIALIAVTMKEHPSFEGGMAQAHDCYCRSCSQARVETAGHTVSSASTANTANSANTVAYHEANDAEFEGSFVAA